MAAKARAQFGDIITEHFEASPHRDHRPEVRNAFRPETIFSLQDAFATPATDPSSRRVADREPELLSGGDQRIPGRRLRRPEGARLNVLDLQRQIRLLPKR